MEQLQEYTDQQRYAVYNVLTKACQHLFSKGKLQTDKMKNALAEFAPLVNEDPLFLAHLTAWAVSERNQSRDLELVAMYLNAISDADGTPFVVGGAVKKPNLRQVTWAHLSSLNPKEFFRLVYLRKLKWAVNGGSETQHFPTSLRTAAKTYLGTLPIKTLEKHVKAGFTRHLISAFRLLRLQPTAAQAQALKWVQQEKRGLAIQKTKSVNPFDGLSDAKIAAKIVSDKLTFRQALSWLQKEPSLPILEALLEAGTPNELLVQTSLFDTGGLLAVSALADRFYAKVARATSADRLDTVKFQTSEGVKERLAEARATSRRKQFGKLDGHLHVAIDKSGSMSEAIATAKEYVSTLVEIAGQDNFSWSLFDTSMYPLKQIPKTKEEAMAILYLQRGSGGTDCFASYRAVQSSLSPAKYFIWLTDGGHGEGTTDLSSYPKPDAGIVIKIRSHQYGYNTRLEEILRRNGIPFAAHDPDLLKSSNLVVQALQAVMKGATGVIEEIMSTDLGIRIPGVNC